MPSREEIDRAMSERAPPPEVQAEIARAQGLDAEVCCVCGVGMVDTKRNARARLAMPVPDPAATQSALPDEEETTQP